MRDRGLAAVNLGRAGRAGGTFDDVVVAAGEEIGLRPTPGAAPRRVYANDEMVDALGHLPWETTDLRAGRSSDKRRARLVSVGRRSWRSPGLAVWREYLGVGVRPLPFLAVPHHVDRPMFDYLVKQDGNGWFSTAFACAGAATCLRPKNRCSRVSMILLGELAVASLPHRRRSSSSVYSTDASRWALELAASLSGCGGAVTTAEGGAGSAPARLRTARAAYRTQMVEGSGGSGATMNQCSSATAASRSRPPTCRRSSPART